MTVLGFEPQAQCLDGRRVRRVRFEQRSALPVSAACVVANGIRETLGPLLATPVALRLLEPMIPAPQAWAAICADAHIFGVRGPACEGAFIIRPPDALALSAAAFGEPAQGARALSAVEQEVLLRAVRGIAGSLAAVCGRDLAPVERLPELSGYVTYFEILIERPVSCRIGVALSRDPAGRGAASLRLEDLLDVQIELHVQFAAGELPAQALLALRPGANVPMTTRIGDPGLLLAGGTVLARGDSGALGERSAMIVTAVR